MTSVNVISLKGEKKATTTLPKQFSEAYRPEIIKRAFQAQESHSRQPYGPSALAGKLFSVYLSKRRRKYRGVYGKGRSRTPRKVLWRRGTQFNLRAAVVPFAVGGRRAHPPKPEAERMKKVNQKERRLAIRSALAASTNIELVRKKHALNNIKTLPIVFEDAFEKTKKTKDVANALTAAGLVSELERVSKKGVRAGKGTMRARKYKTKKGPLVVVSGACDAQNAIKNIPGTDVVHVKNLNVSALAPGAHAGRLIIFTQSALKILETEALFT
ncbi:50S ribosomal protein L4 [archaeon CG10_big_fil_rev_8_21_14_0_10_43_11]|nr:MAG: 50S ribosomal protein L4 [archaeon CG10_big_fil_rev_8_21_14_0_10_43_11]